MRTFFWIWVGQVVSFIGSQLAGFSVGVWFFQQTGSTTVYAAVALANLAPQVFLAPLAGVIIDRLDRRVVIMLGQLGGAACSLALALLYRYGALRLGTALPVIALASAFATVNLPSLSAIITVLVPKAHFVRVNGLLQLGLGIAQIVAPTTAGFLMPFIGTGGVLLIDVASFVVAIGALLAVRIPAPPVSEEGKKAARSVRSEIAFGVRYILARPGLFWLLAFFAVVNFNFGFISVLIAPLVLSFGDARSLGTVMSAGGIGMLVGSVYMMAHGGPKRRIHGVLAFVLLQGIMLFFGGAPASTPIVAAAAFGTLFAVPVVAGSSTAIWQHKVAPDVQGRVFAVRSAVAQATMPIAYLLAGPLADRVFEPMMARGGALAPTVGAILGVGPGRGVALLFVLLGFATITSVLFGYANPRIRRVEDDLPDHPIHFGDAAPVAEADAMSGALDGPTL